MSAVHPFHPMPVTVTVPIGASAPSRVVDLAVPLVPPAAPGRRGR
ncbi:hypothetical protein AB0C10_22235 [Microbispora amethystogenes]